MASESILTKSNQGGQDICETNKLNNMENLASQSENYNIKLQAHKIFEAATEPVEILHLSDNGSHSFIQSQIENPQQIIDWKQKNIEDFHSTNQNMLKHPSDTIKEVQNIENQTKTDRSFQLNEMKLQISSLPIENQTACDINLRGQKIIENTNTNNSDYEFISDFASFHLPKINKPNPLHKPTRAIKKEAPKTEQPKSFMSKIAGVFSKGAPEDKPPEMKLGNTGGFYYDKAKKKWVIEGQEEEKQEELEPPPVGFITTATGSQKRRQMYVDTIGQSSFNESTYKPADHEEPEVFDEGFKSDPKPEENYETLSEKMEISQINEGAKEETKQEENTLAGFKEYSGSESPPSELKEDSKAEEIKQNEKLINQLKEELWELNWKSSEKIEELSAINEELYQQISFLSDLGVQNELKIQELNWRLQTEADSKSIFQEDLENMRDTINLLTKEISSLKSSDPVFLSEDSDPYELQLQIAQLENEKLQFQSNIATKDLEIANLNVKLNETDTNVGLLSKQIERQKHEYELKEQYFTEERQRAQQAVSSFRSQLTQIKEMHRVDLDELEHLRNLVEENDIKIGILSKSKSKADIELKKAIFDQQQAEDELLEATKKLKEIEVFRRNLELEIHQLKMELLSEQNEDFIRELQSQLQLAETEKVKLETLVIESKKEAQNIKHQLSEAEKKLKLETEENAAKMQSLEEEIKEKDKENEIKGNENRKMKEIEKELEDKINMLRDENSEINESLNEKNMIIEEKEKEIAEIAKKIDRLEKEIIEKENKINQAQEINFKVQNEKEDLCKILEDTRENYEEKLSNEISQNSELSLQINELKENIANQALEIDSLKVNIEEILKKSEEAISQEKANNLELTKLLDEAKKELDEKEKNEKKLLEQISELKEITQKLELELKNLEEDKNSAFESSVSLRQELAKVEEEKKQAIESLESLKNELDEKLSENEIKLDELDKQNKLLIEDISSKDRKIQELDSQYEELLKENIELKDSHEIEVEDLNSVINDYIGANGQLRNEVETLKDENSKLSEEILANKDLIIESNETIQELNSKIKQISGECEKYSEEINLLRSQEQTYISTTKDLSDKLDNWSAQNQELLEKAEEDKNILISKKDEELEILQSQFKQAEEDLISASKERNELQQNLTITQEELKLNQDKLSELENTLLEKNNLIKELNRIVAYKDLELCEEREKYEEQILQIKEEQGENLSGDIVLLKNEINDLQGKNLEISKELKEVKEIDSKKSETISYLQSSASNLKDQLNKKDQELKVLKEEMKSINEINAGHEKEVRLLKAKSNTNTELEDYKRKNEELSEEIKSMNKDIEDLYERRWKEQQDATANLEKQKLNYEKMIEELKADFEKQKLYYENLIEENKNPEKKNESEEKQLFSEIIINEQKLNKMPHEDALIPVQEPAQMQKLVTDTVEAIKHQAEKQQTPQVPQESEGWFTSLLGSIFLTDRERGQ
ncbi:unnamed protein product [Blepharisma stoltei]|uniref:Uncharacterized protein n=1 Tax=Blepharisma stoltei TaxID=1481888 RepID=A0AAU9IQZ7_9CILI|nr:unnamed protein product [Blepharisma stoltei]